jgi:hypothetical protein
MSEKNLAVHISKDLHRPKKQKSTQRGVHHLDARALDAVFAEALISP